MNYVKVELKDFEIFSDLAGKFKKDLKVFEKNLKSFSYFVEVDNKKIAYFNFWIENLKIEDIDNKKILTLSIDNFYVEDKEQEKGYGTKILNYIYEIGKKNKVKRIILYTSIEGRFFYINRGFKTNSRTKYLIKEII